MKATYTIKNKLLEIAMRYVDNSKEANDMVSELLVLFDVRDEQEVKSKQEQIADINQWATLLISNRSKLRERVIWSMIADIQNRTTD